MSNEYILKKMGHSRRLDMDELDHIIVNFNDESWVIDIKRLFPMVAKFFPLTCYCEKKEVKDAST